ncbi:MAG: small multi-drug export protein [Clostridia bacterium]|jgi:uncharacterized membrane protein|nr:small multi-drug export protein [Clostridia bacterium]
MTEAISKLFIDIFGSNTLLATFLIALIPVIELKGAIPFGMSKGFWGEFALSSWEALGIAFLGSTIVIPILALAIKPIYTWLDKYKFFHAIFCFFTDDLKNTSQVIQNRQHKSQIRSTIIKIIYVVLFVTFPVPLTGVWSGTCLAILLGLNLWQTFLSVALGNFACGLIVTFVCMIFPTSTSIILYIFIGLLALILTIKLIIFFVKRKKKTIPTAENH